MIVQEDDDGLNDGVIDYNFLYNSENIDRHLYIINEN